eukprot:6015664-Amphidinium_carterae.1
MGAHQLSLKRIHSRATSFLPEQSFVTGQETAGLDGKTPMREDLTYVVCAAYHAHVHCAEVTMVPVCIP